jgi:hypothetical protein
MSDRFWLGSHRHPYADVNLIDFATMAEAIDEFVAMPGPHKVSGPPAAVAKCRAIWMLLFANNDVWLSPDWVLWSETADKEFDSNGHLISGEEATK